MGGGTPRGDAEGVGSNHGPGQESRRPGRDLDYKLAAAAAAAAVAAASGRWVCYREGVEGVE